MENHHTHDRICLLCAQKITEAHPILQHWWVLIKDMFPLCHISWAFRNEEMQNLAKSQGNSRLVWPDSQHNKMLDGKPCARALDFFELREDNVAAFRPRFYFDISQFLLHKNAPIVWGGSWKQFKDSCHYELKKTIT